MTIEAMTLKTTPKTLNKAQLTHVKSRVVALGKAVALKKSLFADAATLWATLPLWLKISLGSVFLSPLLFIAITGAPIALLIAMSLASLATFIATVFLFTNYNAVSESNNKHLEQCIVEATDEMDELIQGFDSLCQDSDTLLAQFQKEKEALNEQIKQLNTRNKTLSAQIEQHISTHAQLTRTQLELQQTIATLQGTVESQKELLDANKEELALALKEHEQSKEQSSLKITELTALKLKLEETIQKEGQEQVKLKDQITELGKQVEEQALLLEQQKNTQTELRTAYEALQNTHAATQSALESQAQCTQKTKEELEKATKAHQQRQGQLLVTIEELSQIKSSLDLEVKKFQEENKQLTKHIGQLGGEITKLEGQTKSLMETERKLRVTQAELEVTAKSLNATIQEQSHLLEMNQQAYAKVILDLEQSQAQLAQKILELQELKTTMALEIDKAKKINTALQAVVSTFSSAVIADSEHRAAFQVRLNEFITNKEVSFIQIVDRICKAEEQLSLVTKELEECNTRYKRLLDKQEVQIVRLEQISERQLKKPQGDSVALSALGIYAPSAAKHVEKQQETAAASMALH